MGTIYSNDSNFVGAALDVNKKKVIDQFVKEPKHIIEGVLSHPNKKIWRQYARYNDETAEHLVQFIKNHLEFLGFFAFHFGFYTTDLSSYQYINTILWEKLLAFQEVQVELSTQLSAGSRQFVSLSRQFLEGLGELSEELYIFKLKKLEFTPTLSTCGNTEAYNLAYDAGEKYHQRQASYFINLSLSPTQLFMILKGLPALTIQKALHHALNRVLTIAKENPFELAKSNDFFDMLCGIQDDVRYSDQIHAFYRKLETILYQSLLSLIATKAWEKRAFLPDIDQVKFTKKIQKFVSKNAIVINSETQKKHFMEQGVGSFSGLPLQRIYIPGTDGRLVEAWVKPSEVSHLPLLAESNSLILLSHKQQHENLNQDTVSPVQNSTQQFSEPLENADKKEVKEVDETQQKMMELSTVVKKWSDSGLFQQPSELETDLIDLRDDCVESDPQQVAQNTAAEVDKTPTTEELIEKLRSLSVLNTQPESTRQRRRESEAVCSDGTVVRINASYQ